MPSGRRQAQSRGAQPSSRSWALGAQQRTRQNGAVAAAAAAALVAAPRRRGQNGAVAAAIVAAQLCGVRSASPHYTVAACGVRSASPHTTVSCRVRCEHVWLGQAAPLWRASVYLQLGQASFVNTLHYASPWMAGYAFTLTAGGEQADARWSRWATPCGEQSSQGCCQASCCIVVAACFCRI